MPYRDVIKNTRMVLGHMLSRIARGVLVAGLIAGALAGVAKAGPFEDAVAAYERSDYPTALRLFRPLGDRGDLESQYNLGLMYRDGLGVRKNLPEAVNWFRKAAGQGDADAQFNLGEMYSEGLGVPQDYVEAVKWCRKAADQGNFQGQLELGKMYREGHGVPQDFVQAHMWFNLAASRDPNAALDHGSAAYDDIFADIRPSPFWRRFAVAKLMTPAQIAEAQRLAREWKPTHP